MRNIKEEKKRIIFSLWGFEVEKNANV